MASSRAALAHIALGAGLCAAVVTCRHGTAIVVHAPHPQAAAEAERRALARAAAACDCPDALQKAAGW